MFGIAGAFYNGVLFYSLPRLSNPDDVKVCDFHDMILKAQISSIAIVWINLNQIYLLQFDIIQQLK